MMPITKVLVVFALIFYPFVITEASVINIEKASNPIAPLNHNEKSVGYTKGHVRHLVKRTILDSIPMDTFRVVEQIATILDKAIEFSQRGSTSVVKTAFAFILKLMWNIIPETLFKAIVPRGWLKTLHNYYYGNKNGYDPNHQHQYLNQYMNPYGKK